MLLRKVRVRTRRSNRFWEQQSGNLYTTRTSFTLKVESILVVKLRLVITTSLQFEHDEPSSHMDRYVDVARYYPWSIQSLRWSECSRSHSREADRLEVEGLNGTRQEQSMKCT
jgi:hypothetical protein